MFWCQDASFGNGDMANDGLSKHISRTTLQSVKSLDKVQAKISSKRTVWLHLKDQIRRTGVSCVGNRFVW